MNNHKERRVRHPEPGFQGAANKTMQTIRTSLLAGLLLLALTAIECRAVMRCHGTCWDDRIPAHCVAVAYGQCEWSVMNSRILLPKLIRWSASRLALPMTQVWQDSILLMLLIGNCVTYAALRLTPSTRAIAAPFTILQAAATVCLQDAALLLPCDLVDLSTWFLFAYCVFTRRRWYWFIPLFLIELHNRETAVFFALWIALDNLVPLARDARRLITGAIAMAAAPAGMLYVRWLRHLCCTRAIPDPGPDYPQLWGQLWNAPHNWHELKELWPGKPFLASTFYQTRSEEWAAVAVIVIIVAGIVRLPQTWFGLRVISLLGAYLTLEWPIAGVNELRTWLCLIPFTLFLFYGPSQLE